MTVRIYKPTKNAMQSGKGNSRQWILEFDPKTAKSLDPLMGWTSSADTQTQLRLTFPTAEAAIAYARENNLAYDLAKPQDRSLKIRAYAENFR